jgi:hypothetical protein
VKVIVNAKVKADVKLKEDVKLKADVKLIANGRLVIVSTCYFVIIDINYPWIYKKCIEGRMEDCYGE